MSRLSFTAVFLCTAFLVACAPGFHAGVRSDVAQGMADADALIDRQKADAQGSYRKLDRPWITGAPVALQPAVSEPPELQKRVAYSHGSDGTLIEAAHFLSEDAGIQIHVTPDAIERAAVVTAARGGYELALQGPLRSVLDQVSTRAGVSWKLVDGQVLVYYLDTRVYSLEAMPSDVQGSATITNASGTGQSGGSESSGASLTADAVNNQTTTVNYAWTFYNDVKQAVESMLSEHGRVAVSPSSSSVLVRDHAAVLDGVGLYLADLNARLKRQVAIELTVLSIDMADTDSFGINWDLLRRSTGGLAVRALSVGDAIDGAANLGAVVVDPGSRGEGSQVLIDALRSTSNAKITRRTILSGMSSQRIHVQSAERRGYLPSAGTILVPQVGVQTTAEQAVQTTGFALTVLPQVNDDGSISLEVQGAISSPRPFRTAPVGDLRIELSNVTQEDIYQRARLASGETMVLTTLDHQTTEERGRGVGSARLPILGGSREARRDRRLTVILLSPYVRS